MDHSAAVGAVRRHLDRHFDRLGEQGSARPGTDACGWVSREVHRRFLRRFVPRGARVLEIGAGAHRFTTELAARGCRVVVTDASSALLAAHQRRVRGTPAERSVLRREVLDGADVGRYADGEFDVVLAYGGPLSAVRCCAVGALRGLLRVVTPDGVVVASVLSLLGSWRHQPSALDGRETTDRRYRWSDVVQLVHAAGGELVDGSASNWASAGHPDTLAHLAADRAAWRRFVEHEVAACAEPGARDGGTHILFAARPA
ncbi:class I SAM-dependent methyltransferase [Pseudonocardia adelaidensis]|uniref:Methyltransferase domain-containing protein n=1 Tax=Pseudonocardia adelaidensis TaxID=648754 RepID=A0ABP9NEY0_9PSEU